MKQLLSPHLSTTSILTFKNIDSNKQKQHKTLFNKKIFNLYLFGVKTGFICFLYIKAPKHPVPYNKCDKAVDINKITKRILDRSNDIFLIIVVDIVLISI